MPIIDSDNQEIDVTAIKEHQGAGEHWNSFTRANLISYSQPSFESTGIKRCTRFSSLLCQS